MSYLNGVYLQSWFSWFGGGMEKTLKKRRKRKEETNSKIQKFKNDEKEKRII